MKPRASGWSLVELMAVLVLAGVLAFLAAPGLGQMVRNYRLDAAVGALYGAVDLTRTQAIARGRRVLLVPLEPGGSNWASGWVVLVDADGDRRPGPGEEVIASHGPVAEGIVITARFTSNKLPHYLAYGPSGRSCTDTSSMAARWGTLSFHQLGEIRHIKINMLGRARVCRPEVEGAGCGG